MSSSRLVKLWQVPSLLVDPTPSGEGSGLHAYAELDRIVLSDQPLVAVLQRTAEVALSVLSEADDVTVTLVTGKYVQTVAFAGGSATVFDEHHYSSGGPALDAALTGQDITVLDTAADPVYSQFCGQARQAGITRILSVGMVSMREISGSVNLYSRGRSGPFSAETHTTTAHLADYASVAVRNSSQYAHAVHEISQVRELMASRAGIEQATGIVMYTRDFTAEQAFASLRETARLTNTTLRDLAQCLVKGIDQRPRP